MVDKRILIGGTSKSFPDTDIRAILQTHLISGMRQIAGFEAPVMPLDCETDVTAVTYTGARPLALVRNKPVFHMNAGHVDFAVDFLRDNGMPSEPRIAMRKRKQSDGTWKEVIIRTNSIAEHVEKLRKYVHIIDSRYNKGVGNGISGE